MNEFKIADDKNQPSTILDTKGLHCPMPLFQTKKEITNLVSGQILQIDGSDPCSRRDLSGWCDRAGHTYLGEKNMNGYISYFIRKG